MLNLINMSISQTKVTADEETSETQNLIPNVMKRDNDTGVCSKDYSKLEHKLADKKDITTDTKDVLTDIIGEFGPWQGLICSLCSLTAIIHGCQIMANKFLTYPVEHWCKRPKYYQSISIENWLNISSPILLDGNFDRCNMFDIDYGNSVMERPEENTRTIACTHWEYNEQTFQDTATQRFDLVCGRKHFGKQVQMAFFGGEFIGVLLVGPFSDYFGRKTAYLTTLTFCMVFGVSGYFVTNRYSWLVTRFLCGIMSLSFNTAKHAYCLELTSGKWKSRVAHYFGILPVYLGHLTLGYLVYMIPNMQYLELIIGIAPLIFMPLWFVLPESPRWLISKGKLKKGNQVLVSARKWNKKPVDRITEQVEKFNLNQNNKETEWKGGMIQDLFKSPGIRRNSIVMMFCWLAFNMGYFGLIYNTPSFDGNIDLVLIFPALMGIPLSISQPYFDNRFGRKSMMTIPLVTAGILILITTGIPKGDPIGNWSVIILTSVSACCCGMGYGIGYLFTLELYPTLYRTTALGMASAAARVGSVLSTLIAMLSVIHHSLPPGIYGIIIFAAGISSMLLWPETLNMNFPETLEECEELSSTQNSWLKYSKITNKKINPKDEP